VVLLSFDGTLAGRRTSIAGITFSAVDMAALDQSELRLSRVATLTIAPWRDSLCAAFQDSLERLQVSLGLALCHLLEDRRGDLEEAAWFATFLMVVRSRSMRLPWSSASAIKVG